MKLHSIGVDLGGNALRAGIVNPQGQVLSVATTRTDAAGGPEAVIDQIVTLVDRVRHESGITVFKGLGIGSPGPLDPLAGVVIAPPILKGWQDVPLAALVERRLGLPVRIENDANAAALAEWRFGAGRDTRSMVFVTVSTGIGGGVIIDGKLLHGRRGLAAEIGHMTVAYGRERCFCGAWGCWEAMASGSALALRAKRRLEVGELSRLTLDADAGPIDAMQVAAAARDGDPLALKLLADEARWLGIGLVNLLHLYSPERIVLGGGVSSCLDLMRGEIERTIAERAMSAYRDVPVVEAALGDHAGVVGAACLFL